MKFCRIINAIINEPPPVATHIIIDYGIGMHTQYIVFGIVLHVYDTLNVFNIYSHSIIIIMNMMVCIIS